MRSHWYELSAGPALATLGALILVLLVGYAATDGLRQTRRAAAVTDPLVASWRTAEPASAGMCPDTDPGELLRALLPLRSAHRQRASATMDSATVTYRVVDAYGRPATIALHLWLDQMHDRSVRQLPPCVHAIDVHHGPQVR